MENKKFKTKRGRLIYLVSLLLFASYFFILIPYFGVYTAENELILFQFSNYVLGGNVVVNSNGYVYSYSFKLNVYLIIYQQLMLLACLGSIFSRNSTKNLIFTMFLIIGCLVASFFVPFFIISVNPQFTYKDIQLNIGYFLQVGILLICLILTLVCYIRAKVFWARRLPETC